jgi:tRNA-Thr(GGU) m(6)t(6)A37 methyltransferase TsaA
MYRPIGVIHSVHKIAAQAPIQPLFAKHCKGQIEIYPEFEAGLDDLEGFSHIYLIYHLHKAGPANLKLKPFLQNVEHGVFATRAPNRPNAIGLSIVELINRERNILHINNVDMLDGTPLLDIKPYTGNFDHVKTTRCGWLDEVEAEIFPGGSQKMAGA